MSTKKQRKIKEEIAISNESCGDPDTITKHLTGRLDDKEDRIFEKHFDKCTICQSVSFDKEQVNIPPVKELIDNIK